LPGTDGAIMRRVKPDLPDSYLTINEACELFALSRSTFYRMLRDVELGLGEIVVRVPPNTGRIRVPAKGFEDWLRRHS
jgi:hypothetical protein